MRHDGKSQQLDAAIGSGPNAPTDGHTTRRDPNATVIGDRYELCELLGAGGMGIVYRARRVDDGTPVALKVLRPELAADERVSARLQREAEAVRRVRHPNVVQLLDTGTAEGIGQYLAFEYLEGGTLSDVLAKRSRLSVETALDIIDQVLAALVAAHAVGVIHRDLKPENVHVIEANEPDAIPTVKVLDFGISRVLADGAEHAARKLTTTGTILGTPIYMPPEQALGTEAQDERVDVYAAGVLLYEMLSGAVPHDGENYAQVLAHLLHSFAIPLDLRVPGIDDRLAEIVHRAIEREPRDRYGSAAEMRDALHAWRRGDDRSEATLIPSEPESKAFPRRPSRAAFVAGALLSFGVAIIASSGQAHEALAARRWNPRVQMASAIVQHAPARDPMELQTEFSDQPRGMTKMPRSSLPMHTRIAMRSMSTTASRTPGVRIVTRNPYRSP